MLQLWEYGADFRYIKTEASSLKSCAVGYRKSPLGKRRRLINRFLRDIIVNIGRFSRSTV